MKTVFQTVLIAPLLTLLVACLTTPPADSPSTPPPDETPIKSAFGAPVGNPVTQTVDANGGTFSEPTTGATVKAFPSGFDASAQVSLQAITDTLPDGIGMGVAISSSQPLKKPLIVRFGYGADEPDPGSLRLALQADDGSWLSLSPVRIDPVNKTVSAALPERSTAAGASNRVGPMGGLNLKRVVKYLPFFMKPASATVKVGQGVEFVPWARVLEKPECPLPPDTATDDDLAALPICPKPIVKAYPFANDKAGFVRSWFVNGSDGGDRTNGTIQPHPTAGATYTAPATAPNPSTVQVRFFSAKPELNQNAFVAANVKIVAADYKVVGDFSSSLYPVCANGLADMRDHVEFVLAASKSNDGSYNLEEIQNRASQQTNFRPEQSGDDVTSNSPGEVITLTGGHWLLNFALDVNVILQGEGLFGACTTVYPPATMTPPFYDPGEPYVSGIDFSFNTNDFVNNAQKVVSDVNPFGTWEFTITRL